MWRAAGKRRQTEERAVPVGDERRYERGLLIAQDRDADHIQPVGSPGFEPGVGDADTVVEQVHRLPGNGDPFGRACGIDIGAHRVCHDCDPDRIGISRRGADIAFRRFDAALHPAEQIDLIGHVQPSLDDPVFAVDAGKRADRGLATVCRVGAERRLRQLVRPRTAQLSAGALQPGDGDADIGIGGERVLDQRGQHRIVIEPPPVRVGRGLHDRRAARAVECAGSGRGGGRSLVIRSGGAGSQGRRAEQEGEEGAYHRSRSLYSAGCSAAVASPSPRLRAKRSPSARHTT